MQRLIIPVEDKIAQTWQQAAPEKRAKIIRMFCQAVEHEDWQTMSPLFFAKMLDEMSDKAIENGLTEAILAEILNEN